MAIGKLQSERWRRVEEFLLHPIRKIDNDASGEAESYPDWLRDHSEHARFYVGGLQSVLLFTGRSDPKFFHSFVEQAAQLDLEPWRGLPPRPPSLNRVRSALTEKRPLPFSKAVQIILACELAVADTIKRKELPEGVFDVFASMKIVPAVYRVEGIDKNSLSLMRANISDLDEKVLSAAGQNSKNLLDIMAKGSYVTRATARAIRHELQALIEKHGMTDIRIGDVRGTPHEEAHRNANATRAEAVDLDFITAME